jgi:hypothetical protein
MMRVSIKNDKKGKDSHSRIVRINNILLEIKEFM